jgi:hypothetical protein
MVDNALMAELPRAGEPLLRAPFQVVQVDESPAAPRLTAEKANRQLVARANEGP